MKYVDDLNNCVFPIATIFAVSIPTGSVRLMARCHLNGCAHLLDKLWQLVSPLAFAVVAFGHGSRKSHNVHLSFAIQLRAASFSLRSFTATQFSSCCRVVVMNFNGPLNWFFKRRLFRWIHSAAVQEVAFTSMQTISKGIDSTRGTFQVCCGWLRWWQKKKTIIIYSYQFINITFRCVHHLISISLHVLLFHTQLYNQ